MEACRPGILFQNGCVLQRHMPVIIWGEGRDKETVTVELGGHKASCVAADGKWECELPAMEAGRGLTLRICCGDEERRITDVSVGEVWLAGGQSNMAYALRYEAAWEETKKLLPDPDIHMFNVPRLAFPEQKKDTPDSGFWFQEQDAAWEFFSAPAYAFARSLRPQLDVPVGIIGCNWGGASASVWVPRKYLEHEPLNVYLKEYEEAVAGQDLEELKRKELLFYQAEASKEREQAMDEALYGLSLRGQEEWKKKPAARLPENPMGPYNVGRPGGLYRSMLERVIPYTMRGVLWYHGESDAAHAGIYDRLFEAVIRSFRDAFRRELPFLFVQLAPFGRWLWCNGLRFPQLRECQERVSRTVDGAYMTSIMDLGMYEDLHPKRKMEVGERLALLAMGKIYGGDVLCDCPSFQEARRTPEGIRITFDHTGEGLWQKEAEEEAEEEARQPSALTGPAEMKEGFLLCCQGKNLPVRQVVLCGDAVLLQTDEPLEEACRVSFAEVGYVRVRIFNSAGLPLKPFHCIV